MRRSFVCAGLVIGAPALRLCGCAPDGVVPEGHPEKEPPGAAALSDSDSQEEDDAVNEGDVKAMVCEPVDQELLERVRFQFGKPTRSVQVEVGEGLTPGELWWVVVLDSPADDSYEWGLRAFLTNAPGLDEGGMWIPVDFESDDPWEYVDWDDDALVRAQSALEEALDYLDAHPSQ